MKKPVKLFVFDFDGTLVDTPGPNTLIEGLPAIEFYDQWLLENNLPKRKFKGYWGRNETLLPPIFGEYIDDCLIPPAEKLNQEIAEIARAKEGNVLSILMTGRHTKMTHFNKGLKQHICETILKSYQVPFDRYYYKSTFAPTIDFKINTIQAILREFPSICDIEIWEDRVEHITEFQNFVDFYVKLGKIDHGFVHRVEILDAEKLNKQ